MPEPQDMHFAHRARVLIPSEERKIKLRALLEDRYAEDAIYPWDAEISNDLLDSHYTHMSESTLRNYVEDANAGVAFLRGHNWRELPIGYSIEAELGTEKGRQRVIAGFYTVRGIADTDDLIKRMEAKLLRDVSVGFHGGRAICDLCGQDFWDCRHFPGLKYETKEGDTVKTELATFTIEDARLSEVSGVFDGSTPQAMIRKAQIFAASGLLEQKQIEVLEQRYRTRLSTRKSFATPDQLFVPLEEEVRIATQRKVKETRKMEEKDIERVRRVYVDLGLVSEEDARSFDESTVLGSAEFLGQVIRNLRPQAAEGRQYRKDLIAAAHAEGVRAQGNDYDQAGYDSILENAPLGNH